MHILNAISIHILNDIFITYWKLYSRMHYVLHLMHGLDGIYMHLCNNAFIHTVNVMHILNAISMRILDDALMHTLDVVFIRCWCMAWMLHPFMYSMSYSYRYCMPYSWIIACYSPLTFDAISMHIEYLTCYGFTHIECYIHKALCKVRICIRSEWDILEKGCSGGRGEHIYIYI